MIIHAQENVATISNYYHVTGSSRPTVVTVFIAHFSRVIHSAEIDRLTAL